jgi:hypothetical protein
MMLRALGPRNVAGVHVGVGDPRRRSAGRAIFATLIAAALFSATTGPVKQVQVLYQHAPWVNDPYDTAVSFAMFFVPLLAAFCVVRAVLCRASAPLPVERVIGLVRGCWVVLGLIAITAGAQWTAVAAGANRASWNGSTGLQIGLLAITTAAAVLAVAGLSSSPVRELARLRAADRDERAGDWLADAVSAIGLSGRWLGPLERPLLGGLTWADAAVVARVRRHPLRTAVLAAAAFGIALAAGQAIGEAYRASTALLVAVVAACGMFALLAGAGSYLGLARGPAPLSGVARRAADATVAACCAVVLALAFRDHLWWIVGGSAASAGLPQMAELLTVAAAVLFSLVFAAESALRVHR